jgi:hypothetical protein
MHGRFLEAVNVVPEHPGGTAATAAENRSAKKEKMEKNLVRMEKIIDRMEKILVKVEKIIVYSWQDWSCYLKAVTRGLLSGHKERALRCLFRSEM